MEMETTKEAKLRWLYDLIGYGVLIVAGIFIGAVGWKTRQRYRAARPQRERNFHLINTEVEPVLRRVEARHPDKTFGWIVSVADKEDSPSNINAVRYNDPEGVPFREL